MQVHYYDLDQHINEHNRWAKKDTDIWLSDNPTVCPFCHVRLVFTSREELIKKLALEDYVMERKEAEQPLQELKLSICPNCTWWHIYRYLHDTEYYDLNQITVIRAIIKRFDIAKQDVAINELGNYLTSKIDDIKYIHHKKMEELVGSSLKNISNVRLVIVDNHTIVELIYYLYKGMN